MTAVNFSSNKNATNSINSPLFSTAVEFSFCDHTNLIGGWTVSSALCDALVQDFKNRKHLWNRAHSARGYHYVSNYDLNFDLIQAYETCLEEVVRQYANYFPYSKEGMAAWTRDERYNFQFYEPGHSYSTWHCENNGEPQYQHRHLAFMTYLNDVNDGGQTHFIHQNKLFSPKKGLTLVWPAYFTHTHRGITAKTEEKYVTTGWYKFFDTKKMLEETLEMSDEDFYNKTDEILKKVA